MTDRNPSASQESERMLAERYGVRPPGERRRRVAIIAVVVGAALAWLLWAAWSAADPEVEAELVQWEVVSSSRVEVEFVLHRDQGDAVTCRLVAQAVDAGVVGEKDVTVAAGEAGEQRVEATIATEREATAVNLAGCE